MDYLVNEAEKASKELPVEDKLETITTYAQQLLDEQEELADLDAKAKAVKERITKLSQELIPQAMLEVNMTEFKLASGKKVAFTEEINCTVKDADKLYEFLDERGDGSLMKIQLEIGKIPKEILAMILKDLHEKFDIMAEAKLTIHPMTLRSYIKSLCGVGGNSEAEMTLAELDEKILTTFTYYKTTVK